MERGTVRVKCLCQEHNAMSPARARTWTTRSGDERCTAQYTYMSSIFHLNTWVLSIMPNWPVRDQWEYPRKIERHFPIKAGQPIVMALVTGYSFPHSLIRAKNRFVKNGTANFGRNILTEISGSPLEVVHLQGVHFNNYFGWNIVFRPKWPLHFWKAGSLP